MDDLNLDSIANIIKSPELIKNIQSIFNQISPTKEETGNDIIVENDNSTDVAEIANILGNSNILSSVTSFLSQNKTERIALLLALRPFLSAEKQSVLDSILQILKVANVLLVSNILK